MAFLADTSRSCLGVVMPMSISMAVIVTVTVIVTVIVTEAMTVTVSMASASHKPGAMQYEHHAAGQHIIYHIYI